MEIGRIEGCTRVIGKSQGYYGLPVRDEVQNDTVTGPGTPVMVTAWFPTPDELAAINAGAPIHLRIVGTGHPPVMLSVGNPPTPYPTPTGALDTMTESWYVIITNPNCELKATAELRRAGLRVYLPKRTFEQVRRGAKVVKSRPAWTGYLLVRFPEALQERGRPKFAIARACQGVKDFLLWMRDTGFNEPAPFPQHVVAAYMRRQRARDYDGAMQARKEREGRRANFRVGMDVQVTAGPFASFMARIEKTHADTAWIVLNIFGRETPMRMENYTDSLEPLAKSPKAA